VTADGLGAVPADDADHTISVVIPVYRGVLSLEALIAELTPLRSRSITADGHAAVLHEVILVDDCGPDGSDQVVRRLAEEHEWIRPVWLSRNFGQHAATLAGVTHTSGEWVVTMDEDGQHDPAGIFTMLDSAMAHRADVVYAKPVNEAPHGLLRNTASVLAKESMRWATGDVRPRDFNSFRLILGTVARSVASYAGPGIYLDVALGWIAGNVSTAPVRLRGEGDRQSGYRFRSLLSHYWRMVITGGTRLLRLVSVCGLVFAALGLALAVYLVGLRLFGEVPVPGWTSLAVIFLLGIGAVLLALGIIAEYLGVTVNMAMGRPLFHTVPDRSTGPHGRPPAVRK
jgi:undecaprenyl-phosphate 4-deoxy-4-formamido-L-arabinose transferase